MTPSKDEYGERVTDVSASDSHKLLAAMGYSVGKQKPKGFKTWFNAYQDGYLITDGFDTATQAWACCEHHSHEL